MTAEKQLAFEQIKHLTYERAENAFKYGRISRATWIRYQREWRNSTPRFSRLSERYQD